MKHYSLSTKKLVGNYIEDQRYLHNLVKEIDENKLTTPHSIAMREQEKGIPLTSSRMVRFYKKYGKDKDRHQVKKIPTGITIFPAQDEILKELQIHDVQRSKIIGMFFNIVFGLPCRDLIIFWDDYKRLIVLEDYKTLRIDPLLIGQFDKATRTIITRQINKANEAKSIEIIKHWAEMERLPVFGCNVSIKEYSQWHYDNKLPEDNNP